jgi:hypothetical protein
MAGTIKKISETEVEVQFLPGGLPTRRTISELQSAYDAWNSKKVSQQSEYERLASIAEPTEQDTKDKDSLVGEISVSGVNETFYKTLLDKVQLLGIGETGETGDI